MLEIFKKQGPFMGYDPEHLLFEIFFIIGSSSSS